MSVTAAYSSPGPSSFPSSPARRAARRKSPRLPPIASASAASASPSSPRPPPSREASPPTPHAGPSARIAARELLVDKLRSFAVGYVRLAADAAAPRGGAIASATPLPMRAARVDVLEARLARLHEGRWRVAPPSLEREAEHGHFCEPREAVDVEEAMAAARAMAASLVVELGDATLAVIDELLPAAEGERHPRAGALFSPHWVEWAMLLQAGGPLPAQLSNSVNYLLQAALPLLPSPPRTRCRPRSSRGRQVLSDFLRLPLPTASDPFQLRWFDRDAHSRLCPDRIHPQAHLERLAAAERRLFSVAPPALLETLRRAEKAPGLFPTVWRCVAHLVYGSSAGRQHTHNESTHARRQHTHTRRQRQRTHSDKNHGARDDYSCALTPSAPPIHRPRCAQAAVNLQMWQRRILLLRRIAVRWRRRGDKAARLIQTRFRNRRDIARGTFFSSARWALDAAHARRQREERSAREEQQLSFRRAARAKLAARRQQALRSSLPLVPSFYQALDVLARGWRTALARKLMLAVRARNARGSLQGSAEADRAAIVWQSHYRAWAARGKIILAQARMIKQAGRIPRARQPSSFPPPLHYGTHGATRMRMEPIPTPPARQLRPPARATRAQAIWQPVSEVRLQQVFEGLEAMLDAARQALLQADIDASKCHRPDGAPLRNNVSLIAAEVEMERRVYAAAGCRRLLALCAERRAAAAPDVAEALRQLRDEKRSAAPRHLREALLDAAAAEAERGVPDGRVLGGGVVAGMRAWEVTPTARLAAVAAADVSSVMLWLREVEGRVAVLRGAENAARRVLQGAAASAELLLGAAEQLEGLRASWEALEELAAAERLECKLEHEVRGCEEADAAARLQERLDAEGAACQNAENLSARESCVEWRAAMDRGNTAQGEIHLLATLQASEKQLTGARTMLRMIDARASRIASVGAKLAKRRVDAQIARAQGAQGELLELQQKVLAAQSDGRTFSTRGTLVETLEQVRERRRHANKELLLVHQQRQARRASPRRADKRQMREAQLKKQRQGMLSEMAAALRDRSMPPSPAADTPRVRSSSQSAPEEWGQRSPSSTAARRPGVSPPATRSDESARVGLRRSRGEVKFVARRMSFDVDKRTAESRWRYHDADGAVQLLEGLQERLHMAQHTVSAKWLPSEIASLLKKHEAEEEAGHAAKAELVEALTRRAEAKEQLRATNAKLGRLRSVGRVISLCARSGLTAPPSSRPPQSTPQAEVQESAFDFTALDAWAVPHVTEAERQWELGHAFRAIAVAAHELVEPSHKAPIEEWSLVCAALQMQPQRWLANPNVIFAPADLRLAADRLGISMERGSSEWSLLWLARELLRAPLPMGWTVAPPADRNVNGVHASEWQALCPSFSCADGHESVDQHPLTATLKAEVALMRRRLKLRMRYFRKLESVWLFAAESADADHATYFFDFKTGNKYNGFPAELVRSPKTSEEPVRKNSMKKGMLGALKAAQEDSVRNVTQATLQAHAEAHCVLWNTIDMKRAAAMKAGQLTTKLRWDALRGFPLCAVDLMHAARALRIDLIKQPELVFMAELALCMELPAGWEFRSGGKGALGSYRHTVSNVIIPIHPLAEYAASLSFDV
ncbi:hypothetical protein AB1Y20_019801 [Prymnesium parvum]|uniref:Uncharacterized protein n=1 Tax=Prymnesium parvum TaxID=97485 RepID=A0AB34JRX8_PRYPA